jgi:hypothetical protein
MTCLPKFRYEQAEELVRSRGGRRITKRGGFCGIWGRKVDVLEQYKQQMLGIQGEVRAARKEAMSKGSTPSW